MNLLLGTFILLFHVACPQKFTSLPKFIQNETSYKPSEMQRLYGEFKQKYHRSHSDQKEDNKRFEIFGRNVQKAKKLQALEEGTAQYGITSFSDLTEDEFLTFYANLRVEVNSSTVTSPVMSATDTEPSAIDWRTLGAVTPVQNQGSCGSCWAFSVTGVIEGQWFRKTKKLIKLSEQQLVDCDTYNKGCKGGYAPNAYSAIRSMGGVVPTTSYPYVGIKGTCLLSQLQNVAYINNTVFLPTDEAKIASWLATNGPVSLAMNANILMYYVSGIIRPTTTTCDPNTINHAVLGVGYGVDNVLPYWTVKNSWGRNWGENGYFRIYRGSGACGINRFASSVLIY